MTSVIISTVAIGTWITAISVRITLSTATTAATATTTTNSIFDTFYVMMVIARGRMFSVIFTGFIQFSLHFAFPIALIGLWKGCVGLFAIVTAFWRAYLARSDVVVLECFAVGLDLFVELIQYLLVHIRHWRVGRWLFEGLHPEHGLLVVRFVGEACAEAGNCFGVEWRRQAATLALISRRVLRCMFELFWVQM